MAKRYYSLFEKKEGKWVRQTQLSFHKGVAVRFFQSNLLNGALAGREMALRVVEKDKLAF